MAKEANGAPVHVDADGISVRVTSPDRVMWRQPGLTVTKRDLVDYYLCVGQPLLRAVRDRPTTLERWPNGVVVEGQESEFFYNKHLAKNVPDYVASCQVTFPSGRTGVQVCPSNVATLVWAAQMGCVTFHSWPVRSADPDRPDELRIDLDPQPGTGFAEAREAAFALREILREAGMDPYIKTSGGRGLHVFVTIEPRWEILEVRHAAIAVGRELERRLPSLVTTAWWKEERGQRVFVDFNQMARDRVMASAWSVRARPGAPVSTPITWDQLGDVEPEGLTVHTVPGIVASEGDPWAERFEVAYSLDPLLSWWRADMERGLGEMPFPPDYPKMPGEPPRVRPSRKAKNSD